MIIVNKVHNRIHVSFDKILHHVDIKIYDYSNHKLLNQLKAQDTDYEIIEIREQDARLKIIVNSDEAEYVKIVS